jgi:hypothetical protein
MIVGQMIVNFPVGRNQFFGNAKFGKKEKKEMKQLSVLKHDIMNASHSL